MNNQITIEKLYELCKKEIKKGNGKKGINISDDNEGNGYHGLFYGFTEIDGNFENDIDDSNASSNDTGIILG